MQGAEGVEIADRGDLEARRDIKRPRIKRLFVQTEIDTEMRCQMIQSYLLHPHNTIHTLHYSVYKLNI